ncbi:MAG TPA: hypothetical protein VII08_19235 [Myxococcales bacterium]
MVEPLYAFERKLRGAAAHLGCSPAEDSVVAACVETANEIAGRIDSDLSPSERLDALADHYSVSLEVVTTTASLDATVERYARAGELGFLTRRQRFDADLIAAILRRRFVEEGQRRFVAMIDAREHRRAMAFHSKAHEVAHPALEPQLDLDFREEISKRDPWESFVDRVASEMVFAGRPWTSSVGQVLGSSGYIELSAVRNLRETMVPEASTTAIAIAAAGSLSRAALILWCCPEVSKRDPVPTLRVLQVTPSRAAFASATFIHRKCRVPDSSPIFAAWQSGQSRSGLEDIGTWVGRPGQMGWTSAIPAAGRGVQAVINFADTR